MQDFIEKEIERRTMAAKELATRFPDLKGLPYEQFLECTLDLGLDLDFVTSVELHKAINQEVQAAGEEESNG